MTKLLRKHQRLFYILISLVFIISCANFLSSPKFSQPLKTIPVDSPLPIEWQSYSNQALNLNFSYPLEWALLPYGADADIMGNQSGLRHFILESPDSKYSLRIDQGVGDLSLYCFQKNGDPKTITINNETFIRQDFIGVNDRTCVSPHSQPAAVVIHSQSKQLTLKYIYYGIDRILDRILSTLKFNQPTPTLEIKTEKQIGYINKVYQNENKTYFDIDYIEWLTGEIGAKACVDDQKCPPECGASCLPNGYYVRNNNNLVRSYALPASIQISLINLDDINSRRSVNTATFKNLITGDNKPDWYLANNLFWITLQNGEVVSIEQQYQP